MFGTSSVGITVITHIQSMKSMYLVENKFIYAYTSHWMKKKKKTQKTGKMNSEASSPMSREKKKQCAMKMNPKIQRTEMWLHFPCIIFLFAQWETERGRETGIDKWRERKPWKFHYPLRYIDSSINFRVKLSFFAIHET